MTVDTLALAHLVWPPAFEAWGPIAFALIAVTLLLEAPVLKTALGVRWDDAVGSIFLAHVVTLVLYLLIAIPLTSVFLDAATSFDVSGDTWWAPWWARLRWIVLTLPGLLIPSGRAAFAWTGESGVGLTVAVGASVLVQLLVVRSVCDLRWSLRNVGTILGVATITAGAVVMALRWPSGTEEEAEATDAAPVEG